MELIRQYMRAHARTLILMALASAASAAVSMRLLEFLNSAATDVLREGSVQALLKGAGLLAAFVAARAIGAAVAARFGAKLVAALRRDLCARFLALDYERLAPRKHAIFGALIGDVNRISQAIQTGPMLLTNTLLTAAGLTYMAWLSPQMMAVVLPFIGLSALLFFATQRMGRRGFDAMRRAEESLTESLRMLVEGKKELTLSTVRAEHFLRRQLDPAIDEASAAQHATAWRWGINDAWAEALGYGWVLAAILSGRYFFDVSAEVALQFVITGLFISGPLGSLFDLGSQFASATASLRHLDTIGLAVSEPDEAKSTGDLTGWSELQLDGITYRYPDNNDHAFAFGPMDFTLTRGETVFVTGGNGSGKSTLLLILTGLIQAHEGRLVVDGRPFESTQRQAWRNLFGAVFFDFALFRHTLNTHGKPAASGDAAHWLGRVQMDHKVQLLGDTFSTLDLSQGQRKRLALVQMCLEDRDVMVFDEFTADQDKDFREHFYRDLLPELKARGKTLVVVSHDDRYWSLGDRVIHLDRGLISRCADASQLSST